MRRIFIDKRVWLLSVLACIAPGCGEEEIRVGRGVPATPAANAVPRAETLEEPDAGATPQTFHDEAFVEAETNRDPFRGFAQMFVARPTRDPVQREVVMPRTTIDEMRLIAIVSGVANPSAMLIDRDGMGYSIHRGDYLGRAEVVQTGGESELPITLNWRVDRIRPGEVVITRDDPTAPNRPPLTRVLALHEEEETTENAR